MKIKLLFCSLIIYILVLTFSICYGSTNTFKRNDTTLNIADDINITASVKQAALSTPYVDSSEKIYDFADLFTYSEENELYAKAMDFIDEFNIDLVIVTIDDNNKSSAMAYADDFYDYNDFGTDSNHSGILFLIDMDNRKLWISTTGSAISTYSDNIINKILDNCTSYATDGDYYTCATKFIDSCSHYYNYKSPIGIIMIIIASLAIPSIFCIIVASRHKSIKLATNANNYLDNSTVNLTSNYDTFIRTYTSRVIRSSESSGGSSGTHSGSSGHSHGGGGRSF